MGSTLVFGYSIALSGDTLLVGVPRDDVGTAIDQGSAYIFLRSGSSWAFQQKLIFANGLAGNYFGVSVALDGETAVIGTTQEVSLPHPNVAYVFTRIGANWSLQQTLTANDAMAASLFGQAVALKSDTILVGAPNVSVGMQAGVGAAYVFTRSGGSWSQQQKLIASDGMVGDRFGSSVALSGETLLVGASGVNNQTQSDAGAAYVFTRSGTSWTQQQKIFAGEVTQNFGFESALSGDTALIAASGGSAYVFTRNGANWTQQRKFGPFGNVSVALSGDTAVLGGLGNATVYVFTRTGTVWTQLPPLTASDGMAGDGFGISVALSGDTLAVGAFGDDIGANAEQGSAYVFTCLACPVVTLTPNNLPNGAVNASYNQAITVSGGTGPYQFSVSSGALPPGFTLGQSGLLFGTPTTAGTFSFTLTAMIQSSLCSGSRSFTLVTTSSTSQVTSVSAASYTAPLAPESIAAAFGANLSATTQVAGMNLLPTQLAGVSLKVKDALGVERLAPLFFVSPGQINYQIPSGTANGAATVTVTNNNSTVGSGTVNIVNVAPGLFAANANAQGIAAALALRVRADGSLSYEPVAQFDAAQNRFVPLPIDLGLESDQVFLVLYGTGIRFRSAQAAVTATTGGLANEVLYAGTAPGFVGLDQVNLRLQRSLVGRGEIEVVLNVEGRAANAVRINVR